jgi:hypothetical protein
MKLKITALMTLIGLFTMQAFGQETPPADTLAPTVENINQTLDVLKRLKFSGYIQAQYQVIDSAGAATFAGGNFAPSVDKRFMMRRARLKVQYDGALNAKGIQTSQYVFQFDVSEGGLTIKDVYAKFTDPWSGWLSLTAGMQNRPFGYEIIYSSGLRESPERGRMSQIIFRNERDLGAMVSIQGPKFSAWNWIKLDFGWFNGTGAPSAGQAIQDFDKKKDFISHLAITRANKSESVKWSVGASYYDGAYRVDNDTIYSAMNDSAGTAGFKIESSTGNKGKYYAARKYVGFDAQVSIDWMPGLTTLRAEYIQGDQPAPYSSSTDPGRVTTSPFAVVTTPVYKRKFNGAYFYFLQNIGSSPFQAIVKYDWYDPNTDVAGDEIGKSVQSGFKTTNATDVKYDTWGFGLAWRADANIKFTAYWDKVTNETTTNIVANNLFYHDLQDDVFTLRMQVKF